MVKNITIEVENARRPYVFILDDGLAKCADVGSFELKEGGRIIKKQSEKIETDCARKALFGGRPCDDCMEIYNGLEAMDLAAQKLGYKLNIAGVVSRR